MNDKSFTIIIPYYNSSSYIEKNIESIATQNYDKSKIQILLIDDGSKEENTQKFISILAHKHKIDIDYHRKDNGNWGSVINFVVKNKLIKNDLVMVLDSDDKLKQGCFEYVNKNILDADIYAISFKRWDGKDREYKKIYPYWSLSSKINPKKKKTPFCGPLSFFYKKELFNKIKPLEEKVFYQDSVLLAQIINMTDNIRYTRKIFSLYFYKRENSSTSMDWNEKRFNEEYLACLKLVELGWAEIVAQRLAVRQFRKCCDKYNKKFELNYKFHFNFFPFYIRFLYWIFYTVKIKKYFIKTK